MDEDESNEFTKEFFSMLDLQRRQKRFCDIILIAEGNEFPVHKLILASVSSYFNKMFEHNSGFTESTLERIELKEVKGEVLRKIIEFSYNQKVNINEENAQLLYEASHLFQYKTLPKMCVPIIRNQINIENCLNIWQFSQLYDEITLSDSVSAFIGNNLSKIIKEKAFLDLNRDQIVNILNRTEIIYQNEESIFEGIIAWVKEQEIERKNHLSALMQCLKINNLSANYLTNVVSNEPLMMNVECQKMIIEGFKFNHNFKNQLIGFRDKSMYIYNIGEQNWSKPMPIPTYHDISNAIVLDNKLYVFGFYMTNEVNMYDPRTNSWTCLCPMLYQHCNPLVIILNGKIYVADNRTSHIVEVYDPKMNTWNLLPDPLFTGVDSLLITNNCLCLIDNCLAYKTARASKFDPIKYNWTLEDPIKIDITDLLRVGKNKNCGVYMSRHIRTEWLIQNPLLIQKSISELSIKEVENVLDEVDVNRLNVVQANHNFFCYCFERRIKYIFPVIVHIFYVKLKMCLD